MSAPGSLRARYERYIQSAGWRASPARLEELRLCGGRCRLCAEAPPDVRLDVHHNSYERFGQERPEDLCALCRPCHVVVTAMLRQRRNEREPVPSPDHVDTPRVLPRRALADSTARGSPDVP